MVEKIIKNNNLKIFFIYIINMNKKEINDNSFKYIFDQTKFVHENKNVKKSNIDLVNIESDLSNRSRFLSKCPTKLYQPKKNEKK
tara:strand:+ start:3434 stop:3688 length:255 start_codon:yes stop_codon:yes gene_type:complete